MSYDLGDLILIQGEFRDPETVGSPRIDPSTVTFKVKTPAAVTTSYVYGTDDEVVRSSLGLFHLDVSADEAGSWAYRIESTGTGQAAAEGTFDVKVSATDGSGGGGGGGSSSDPVAYVFGTDISIPAGFSADTATPTINLVGRIAIMTGGFNITANGSQFDVVLPAELFPATRSAGATVHYDTSLDTGPGTVNFAGAWKLLANGHLMLTSSTSSGQFDQDDQVLVCATWIVVAP